MSQGQKYMPMSTKQITVYRYFKPPTAVERFGPPQRFVGRILRYGPLWIDVRVRMSKHGSNKKWSSHVVRLPYSWNEPPFRKWEGDQEDVDARIDMFRRRCGMLSAYMYLAFRRPEAGKPVDGAPFQIGHFVEVVAAVDQEVHDVTKFIGKQGFVVKLDYDSGVGQSFPDDPMIIVKFDSNTMAFWKEELKWLD